MTLLLFFIEVLIALYLRNDFIRSYVGDFLVVILLYCFVRTFLKAPVITVAIGVLLFSFVIETGQYFHFIALIGLQHSTLARVVLGDSFTLDDLIAYTVGILMVTTVEKLRNHPLV